MDSTPFDPAKSFKEFDISEIWAMEQIPEFTGLLDTLDQMLMEEISNRPELLVWFDYFSTPGKPMNPREFLYFWSSLKPDEQWVYALFDPEEVIRWQSLARRKK